MKRIFIIISLLLSLSINTSAQSNYKRVGNNFTQVTKNKGTQSVSKPSGYTWTTSKGDTYPIYLSKNGRAFIMRVSKKTGNEYKSYLGEDVSREICKLTGTQYVEKK